MNAPSIDGDGYRLYLGNIGRTTDEELRALIEPYGKVKSVHLVKDALTGNSDGYAFVEMSDEQAALRALSKLKAKLLNGNPLIARALF